LEEQALKSDEELIALLKDFEKTHTAFTEMTATFVLGLIFQVTLDMRKQLGEILETLKLSLNK